VWVTGTQRDNSDPGYHRVSNFRSSIRIETGDYLRRDGERGEYEESDIDSSSGGRPDWFTVGSSDIWGAAASGSAVSRVIEGGTVSGTKEEVDVVIFLVGCDAVSWLDAERKLVLTTDDMVDGSVVRCIGSAAVLLQIRSLSRRAR